MAHPRVLIIDSGASSPAVSLCAHLRLLNSDATIDSATSAAAGLYYLTVHQYDVVICNDSMPSIDHARWFDHIEALSSRCHLVVMRVGARYTGNGRHEQTARFQIVKKSISLADLLGIIGPTLSDHPAPSHHLISR